MLTNKNAIHFTERLPFSYLTAAAVTGIKLAAAFQQIPRGYIMQKEILMKLTDATTRREKLLSLLMESEEPLSGSLLARKLGVSRQVIVQDIALLRAGRRDILSTARGYLLYAPSSPLCRRCFLVNHTNEQIEDELGTIVDLGGKVLDVIVTHPIYGVITADLLISSRQDVSDFVRKIQMHGTKPLKELTDGVHYHTVEASSETILDAIEQALAQKNYLLPPS